MLEDTLDGCIRLHNPNHHVEGVIVLMLIQKNSKQKVFPEKIYPKTKVTTDQKHYS